MDRLHDNSSQNYGTTQLKGNDSVKVKARINDFKKCMQQTKAFSWVHLSHCLYEFHFIHF